MEISLAILKQVEHNFKNADALLPLLGLCSKHEKLDIFLWL